MAFVLTIALLAVAGFASDASAQVYQGTLKFDSSPFVFSMTVTLQPSGPALYRVEFLGQLIDTGLLVASVHGSSVSGFIQSSDSTVASCFFQGNYNGTTATLSLNPGSCGSGGSLVLTRA